MAKRQRDGTVTFRPQGNKDSTMGLLSVPTPIAVHIPFGSRFLPELTDEGILFRYVGPSFEPASIDVPAWVRDINGGAE